MPAGPYNFVCEQGADFQRTITWQDDTLVAVDVTGYTAHMQVRTTLTDSAVLLELSNVDGSIIVGTTDGTFTLKLAAADTLAIAPVVGVYDLFVTSPAGSPTRLLAGTFTVRGAVTR